MKSCHMNPKVSERQGTKELQNRQGSCVAAIHATNEYHQVETHSFPVLPLVSEQMAERKTPSPQFPPTVSDPCLRTHRFIHQQVKQPYSFQQQSVFWPIQLENTIRSHQTGLRLDCRVGVLIVPELLLPATACGS